jgi:outer membrane protein TolC
MKKIALFVFFLFAIGFGTIFCDACCSGNVEPVVLATLSMEQAVEQAKVKKPSVHAFRYSIENYQHLRKGTLSTFLPNISLNETFYNRKNPSNLKDSFVAQASQTVLDLSKVNHYKMLDAQVSGARHQLEGHKDDVQLATETAFLSAWLLQQKVDFFVLLYEASKKIFEQKKNQYDLNLLDKNEYLKARAEHAGNLATVNTYKQDLSEAEKTLEYYIQDPISLLLPKSDLSQKTIFPTKLKWDPEKKAGLEPFDFYYKKAIVNRKDLKIKQDTINLKSHTSQFYAKQYLPTVSLFGAATKSTIWNGDSTFNKEAGLRISWNIFDGLSNYFNKNAARAEKLQAILEKHDLSSQIKLEVQQAYSALKKEIDSLSAEKVEFKQSTNEIILRKQQHTIKLISDVDYQSAKFSYENSKISWITRSVSAELKRRELLKNCGYPSGIV